VRRVAHRHGRRSLITRLGVALVGGAALPMLPFDRSGQFTGAQAAGAGQGEAQGRPGARPAEVRVLALLRLRRLPVHLLRRQPDQCPPGTEASKVSWVGTCLNPQDGRQYLVSYNDCCGKASCGECLCNNNERERPGYRLGVFNDINWCMANTSPMFHCTTSVIVGVA
jgi:methylamine dehydrogenase light chain